MKVYFENIEHGWVDFRLEANGKNQIHEGFSYTPYDSFLELVDALFDMKSQQWPVQKKATFNTEPYEYEFHFKKENEKVHLNIVGYPDHRRMDKSETIYAAEGTYEEICLPFWRGLRRLQGMHSAEELDKRWQRSFPSSEIDALTRLLKG
ncbi:hypothetical protein HCH_03128 [Hahella chejuensis KCTC 2396]|uniref:Uncharacterized protein n=1 Tax=Hahella chejuensis (strain KCTC 2396) TaxID=349521 RepID=Q2SHI2_HAHCH|nr:hypothetical protein [Hahella chejuensis]ABC29892.1 hypothetical protein HCH_03128 [Hahella chejuensis KCTC 2396]